MSILASAADILRCFSPERLEITVTDVSQRLGWPKSNVSRLLRSMQEAGFLEQAEGTKGYRLGLMLHEAGYLYRFGVPLIERASKVVTDVSKEVGHTGYVSLLEGRDVVVAAVNPGRQRLRVVNSVGERFSAASSSSGRALLARLPDKTVADLFADGITPSSPAAPQDAPDLLERLSRVRRQGFAEASNEAYHGVGAVSVSVGEPGTGDEVALCIAYPSANVAREEIGRIVSLLSAGASGIAAITGDPRFRPALMPA